MAFNLIAEAARVLDWDSLHAELTATRRLVELFPIASSEGCSDALGISVPLRAATEEVWAELVVLIGTLTRAGMRVHDLHTGREVLSFEALRRELFG